MTAGNLGGLGSNKKHLPFAVKMTSFLLPIKWVQLPNHLPFLSAEKICRKMWSSWSTIKTAKGTWWLNRADYWRPDSLLLVLRLGKGSLYILPFEINKLLRANLPTCQEIFLKGNSSSNPFFSGTIKKHCGESTVYSSPAINDRKQSAISFQILVAMTSIHERNWTGLVL